MPAITISRQRRLALCSFMSPLMLSSPNARPSKESVLTNKGSMHQCKVN
ncbi:hypothetical protein [Colwellia sp. MB3u-4]|nr:hypothetical protein [Colwellia sp. MB3u-4]MBA6289030.1 hypothetical protein [Colwellia sp. MB3u-4]